MTATSTFFQLPPTLQRLNAQIEETRTRMAIKTATVSRLFDACDRGRAVADQAANNPALRDYVAAVAPRPAIEKIAHLLHQGTAPTLEHTKEAFFGDMMKGVGTLALGAGAIGLTNKALDSVSSAYASMTEGKEKSRAYAEMINVNPNLAREDKVKVMRAFDTCWRFNPEVAKDPLAAGSFVGRVVEYNAVTTDDVKKMIEMRNTSAQARANLQKNRAIPPVGWGGAGFGTSKDIGTLFGTM